MIDNFALTGFGNTGQLESSGRYSEAKKYLELRER